MPAKSPSLVPGQTATEEPKVNPATPAQEPAPDPDVVTDELPPPGPEALMEEVPARVVFMCDKFPGLKMYCDRGRPGVAPTDLNPEGTEGKPPWKIEFVDGMFPGPGREVEERDIAYIKGLPPYTKSKLAPYWRTGIIYDPQNRGAAAAVAQLNSMEAALIAQGFPQGQVGAMTSPFRNALNEKRRKMGEPEIVSGARVAGPQPRPAPVLKGNLGAWPGLTPNINKD